MTHRKTGSFYDLLGVSPKATPDQIRRAFLAQARRYHPDLNRDDPQAEWQFKRIRRIYEVLIDPLQRATYDDFPARFSLDDVGNDWINQTTIVTAPSRRRPAEDPGTRRRASGSWERGVLGSWPRTEGATRQRIGLLALCLSVLILLGLVSWMLPQPTRDTSHRPMTKVSRRHDSATEKKAPAPTRASSAAEDPTKPSVPQSTKPAASRPQSDGTVPSPANALDGIDRALPAVPYPNPLAPGNATFPPADGSGSTSLLPLTPSVGSWGPPSISLWPLNRNDFHSVVNAPIGPANVLTYTGDLPPMPPLFEDPLGPELPSFDQTLTGIGPRSATAPPRYEKAEIVPSTVAPGFPPAAPQLDAVSRENLVIELRERLNPAGAMLPTFPAGLPTTPSAVLPIGPTYPSPMGPVAGGSPTQPTAGLPHGMPFLPPSVLMPAPVTLPQRPAMPTAFDVGISPPYFGPAPPAPRRP